MLSTDAGETWRSIQIELAEEESSTMHLMLSPDDQEITAATSDGLFRSNDAGQSWARLTSSLFEGPVLQMTRIPDNEDAILIYARSTNPFFFFGVFRSLDNAQTWDGPLPVLLNSSYSSAHGRWAVSQSRILMQGSDSMNHSQPYYYSDDVGDSWTTVTVPHGDRTRSDVFAKLNPSNPEIHYYGSSSGLLMTSDAGESFDVISEGMGPEQFGSYSAGADVIDVTSGAPSELFVGSLEAGLYWSDDSGENWVRRNSGLHQTNIRSLAINSLNTGHIYAAEGDARWTLSDNLWFSSDGGTNWSASSNGLELGGVRGLTLDPNTAETPSESVLFAAGWGRTIHDATFPSRPPSHGVFRSQSGAAQWSDVEKEISAPEAGPGRRVMRAVVLDPASGEGSGPAQSIWVAGDGYIDYDNSDQPIVRQHRIYRSANGGNSWSPSDNGLPIPPGGGLSGDSFVQGVVPMVISSANPEVLYVGTTVGAQPLPEGATIENGVFKTVDGGQTWQLASAGLPRMSEEVPNGTNWDVLALGISQSNSAILYAAVNHRVDGIRQSQIFRTNNGAQSWQPASSGIPLSEDIRAIAVDPDDANTVYAASSGKRGLPGGVYRSIDGGQSWNSYSIGLPKSVTSLLIDKSNVTPALIAGGHGGVYRLDLVADDDLDSVPDSLERGAPNDGDGNSDGILDELQTDVASFPMFTRSSATEIRYITMEIADSSGPQCTQFMDAHAIGTNELPVDTEFEYPYGLLGFQIQDCLQATIRITHHQASGVELFDEWNFRAFAPDPAGKSHTFYWRALGSALTADNQVWELSISEGQFGDSGPHQGSIRFRGGLSKRIFDEVFDDRFEVVPRASAN
jgi:photosystem II stability/assembly factor-like uncharacterized protein